ncbi:MAG: A24 family peptidase [Nanoarchaeota archaeon]|nr:A24 family peptidase [Nanoarchaeota archaeon]
MERYYFLFILALAWIIFATVQDLRKREVANWLTYSLIIFALAYRAFYSIFAEDISFFAYGILGFGLFWILAYAFYYGRIFAGGDAKLLMGLGAVIPGENINELGINLVFFLFLLFFLGAVYSLIFSLGVVYKKYSGFKKEFVRRVEKEKRILFTLFIFYIILILIFTGNKFLDFFTFETMLYFKLIFYLVPFIFFFTLLFIYLKSLEYGALIVETNPKDLREGDWLERDVRIGKNWIKKSVHGLSLDEIKILREARKKVWIREGIPFIPAFLIAFLAMLFFFFVLRSLPQEIFLSLS